MLLIDAGNSRLKWSKQQANGWSSVFYVEYCSATRLVKTLALLEKIKPTSITMTHVLGQAFESEVQAFCECYRIMLRVIRAQKIGYGIKNAYHDASKLGADRFVGLVAVHYKNQCQHNSQYKSQHRNKHQQESRGKQSIMISCGTAITIDAINQRGEHLGGVILPGLQLWKDMLIKGTVLLEQADETDSSVLATSTMEGITAGSLYGLAGAIDRVCDEMKQLLTTSTSVTPIPIQVESSITLILTGGCAEFLLPYLRDTYILHPNLVIQGLQIIAKLDNKIDSSYA